MQIRVLWLIPLLVACSNSSGEPGRLTSVTITPRSASIGTAGFLSFQAIGSYDDGSSHRLTGSVWQSSVPSVATIDAAGVAVGKAVGTTIIRVDSGGLKDSTTLNVYGNNAMGPLRVSTVNPRYFADPSGRVVYLTGSHYWKNVQDNSPSDPPSAFDNVAYLNFLQQHNHNFTRLWVWEQARWSAETSVSHYFSPTLYVRTGPGTGADGGAKFDLTQINPAYLARLRQRVIDAGARGIYVSVMLFDGWSIGFKGNSSAANPWLAHPFNAQNNVNGIDGDTNGDGNGMETQTLSIPQVTALQEAYVRAVIDAVNDLDNVIYEISNESDPSGDQWQYHMISLIRSYEAGKPKQHPIGMTVPYPNASNTELLASGADWVSINGDVNNPVVADGSKVSLFDTDHLCGICGDYAWPWRSITRGHNPLLMDGYDGSAGVGDPNYNPNDSIWELIRTNMGVTRSYALRMDLAHAVPRGDLSSSGYCLAVVGSEYLIFMPSGGATVNLSGVSGQRTLEWYNPFSGETVDGGTVTGGGTVTVTQPWTGMAVLYIHQ